jgi:hypothetical protein
MEEKIASCQCLQGRLPGGKSLEGWTAFGNNAVFKDTEACKEGMEVEI